jgi:arginyl-tRNA synthetase
MKFKVDAKNQKAPKIVAGLVDKTGVAYKLQELVWKVAREVGVGENDFLDNIDWFWRNIKKTNYIKEEAILPIGAFSRETVNLVGARERLVWLRAITFAKIRGWRQKQGFEGHREISRRYFRAIPLVLFFPDHVIRRDKEKNRYLFVKQLWRNFVLVVEVGSRENRNWLVTAFVARERYLERKERECLAHKKTGFPAGTAISPILASAKRSGGSRFSTLQDTRNFYNILEEKCQEGILSSGLNFRLEEIQIEHPVSAEHGDYATNVAMVLAKILKAKPFDLAQKIVERLIAQRPDFIEKVEAVPAGFINFRLSKEFLLNSLVQSIELGEKYGANEIGRGKTVVIDYSSPNIAKSFGVGHLRSTNIGQALYNIYKFLGWKTIGDNHLGDWGTQFGKLIVALKKWGENEPSNFTIKELEGLYIKFHKEAEKDTSLEDEARAWFKKLEDGDQEARKIWQACVKSSLKEFERIYDLLGVKIDFILGESFYEDKMDEIVADAQKKGVAKKSEGALVIEVPGIRAPVILLKSDGATTYHTRDLATIEYRVRTWKPDLYIYEVGAEQTLYFKQVFGAAALLGYGKLEQFVHIGHGLIRRKEGKFSTRQGMTIHLEEVLQEAMRRARELAQEAGISKDLSARVRERIARAVGIGAVKYNDLKQGPERDIIFDWDKILSLEGNSGPYLQYTYARAQSVLRKAGKFHLAGVHPHTFEVGGFNEEEMAILRTIYKFPEVVLGAAKNFAPNLICNFLFDLAQKYNNFYNLHPIIKAPSPEIVDFRLALTKSTAQAIKNGLTLLGIEALERM